MLQKMAFCEKNQALENNLFKKYISLQRFNKAIDCITF